AKAEGGLLSLPTVNLLPGTVLEIAEAAPGGAFGLPAPVGKTKGVLPRLVDAYVGPTGGAPALRVYLPPAVSAQSKTFYRFRLRGPDGSISETIAFTRVGDAIPAPATVAVRGLAAPVDATTVAPVVELLSAGDAKAVLEYAGLSAAFVAFGSQRPVAAEQLRNALVLGQGVAPGERVLRGERVTLAIESSEPPLIVEPQPIGGGLVALDDVPLRDLTEGAKTSLGPAAIDVGDFAGFVDLRTPGAPPRRPKEADDESRLLDESELTGASGLAGLIDGPRPGDPLKPGERVKPGDAWGGLVRIELDPGLSLPIDRTPEENVVAGLLKLVVLALFEQPSPLDLPGALGAAVRDALLKHELAWRKALERVDPNNEPPFADVLDTVTKSLKVSLSNNDKQQALEAWRRYARLRPRLWQLDRNRNVFVTDDAAVWAIEWMIQRGLLNPATLIEVKLQIDGPPLAVLPPIPSLPDWIDSTPPPLVIPNGPTVSPPSVGPRPPQPNGPAKPNPPTN
ncbi:MAG TPA: hypothetical protein VGE52_16670, partial [Pirellulales bacterium]